MTYALTAFGVLVLGFCALTLASKRLLTIATARAMAIEYVHMRNMRQCVDRCVEQLGDADEWPDDVRAAYVAFATSHAVVKAHLEIKGRIDDDSNT